MQDPVDEYRRLLTAEESSATVDAALRLLDRALSDKSPQAKIGRPSSAFERILASKERFVRRRDDQRALTSAKLRHIYWSMSALPAMLGEVALRLSDSQYSFLMDLLLLVFHNTYFAILPRLKNGRPRSQYAVILQAMRGFADRFPDEADRFRLLGLIHAELGETARAAEAFRAAISATHADDHEFMSRVQTLWMFLLHNHRDREALLLLLDVYPRVSRTDLDEMRTLLMETFAASTRRRSSA